MATKKPAAFVPPKNLAACVDMAYELRQQRLEESKGIKVIQEKESILKHHLIDTLPVGEASGIAGQIARCAVVTKQVATLKDAEALFAWIKKQPGTTGFRVLTRGLSDDAIRELWDAGKQVPGVEPFTTVGLSLTKL